MTTAVLQKDNSLGSIFAYHTTHFSVTKYNNEISKNLDHVNAKWYTYIIEGDPQNSV